MAALVALLFMVVIVVTIFCLHWQFRKSERLIRQWAATRHYQLLGMNHQWFWYGPFWWRTAKGQMVYHVTLRDSAGQIRKAWIRCGSFLLGLLSDDIAVEWER